MARISVWWRPRINTCGTIGLISSIVLVIGFIALWVGAIAGWVMNIIAIVGGIHGALTTEMIVRLIGVPFFPLGAIMGWVA